MSRSILPIVTLTLLAGCHPWFKSRFPWQEGPDPNQQPVITNSAGETYLPGTPAWIPKIDDCMREGGSRPDCIDALPAEDREALEQWERERARRGLLLEREGFGVERTQVDG